MNPTPSKVAYFHPTLGGLFYATPDTVNFGHIWVAVRHGRLVLDSPPRVIREVKIGGENGRRPESRLDDFLLKKEIVECLAHLATLEDATVCIEIKHGLPFKITVEEVFA